MVLRLSPAWIWYSKFGGVTTSAVVASRIFSTTCDSGRFNAMVLVREDSLRELETPIATNTGKEYNSSALRLVRFGNRFVVISFVGGFFLGFFDATYEAGYNQAVMDSGGYYDDGYNEDLEDFFDQGYVDFWDP